LRTLATARVILGFTPLRPRAGRTCPATARTSTVPAACTQPRATSSPAEMERRATRPRPRLRGRINVIAVVTC